MPISTLTTYDVPRLRVLLRAKAKDRSYRELEAEVGVSAATLCRLARGRMPSVETLCRVCDWLGVGLECIRVDPTGPPEGDAPLRIAEILHADPRLQLALATAIAEVVRLAYEAATLPRERGC